MAEGNIVKWSGDPAVQDAVIERAAGLILAGEVVAFPTDTVYGIGAHAWNGQAVGSLYAIKERPAHKAIALLISEVRQLASVTDYSGTALDSLARAFWPGGLTIVVPWRDSAETGGQGFATVGVRMPNHPIPLALISRVGAPLATTSANLSGQPSAVTAGEVARQIGDRVALIIDGGACPGGVESTVVDLTADPPTVRRIGAVPAEALTRVVGHIKVEK